MAEIVKTPKCTLGYPNLFEMREGQDGKKKYSALLVFDSEKDIEKLKSAMDKEIEKKYGVDETGKPKVPFKFVYPFKTEADANPEKSMYQHVKGKVFINVDTTFPLSICGMDAKPTYDQSQFYSGCKVVAALTPYVYEVTDDKGQVTRRAGKFYIAAIQKAGDGEPWQSRVNGEDIFIPFTAEALEEVSL
jgi:hypothetical protein